MSYEGNSDAAKLKEEILRLTRQFARLAHAANRPGYESAEESGVERPPFIPGQTPVPYAGRVFTEHEVAAAVGATLDFWLTLGPEGEAFEKGLAQFLGVKASVLCNSGSSANLLAMAALSSPRLGARRLKPGDEVITVAAGFPTTVAPILQSGFVPVFIDNDPLTLNGRVEQLEEARESGRAKALLMAHTLGNPFDLATVTEFCRRHDLWLIEDNCDALGCAYDGRPTGSFGDLSTQSFYPPHHLTLGEGGAVNVRDNLKLRVIVESFRDWGRDCWCASGKDNTCGRRFQWKLGELPEGYDHKYIYSHSGLQLEAARPAGRHWQRPTSQTAAVYPGQKGQLGTAPPRPGASRGILRFHAPHPRHRLVPRRLFLGPLGPPRRLLLVRLHDAGQARRALYPHRTGPAPGCKKIGNRMLFGGNLLRQPAFVQLRKDNPAAFRVVGDLTGADRIMNQAIFIGAYPGLTGPMLDYMIETVSEFVKSKLK